MTLTQEGLSDVDQIRLLLNQLSNKLPDLPAEQRNQIEEDLQEIRSSINGLLAAKAPREPDYREVAEALSDPFVVYDASLHLMYRNRAAREATRLVQDAEYGKTFSELYPDLVGGEIHQMYLRALETRQVQRLLSRWVRPADGKEFYYDLTLYPTSAGLIAFSKDVTDKVRSERVQRELYEQAVWMARLPDENPNPVARIAYDGKILYCNAPSADPGGWSFGRGERISAVFQACLSEAIQQGKQVKQEVQIGQRLYSVNLMPFPNEQYINLYGLDITERKQAEDELRRSEVTLRESESRLHEFIESTHDIFFTLDHEWRVTYANQNSGKQIGVDPEKAIGMNFWALFPQMLGTDVETNYRKVMAEKTPIHFQQGGNYTKSVYDISLYPTREGLAIFAIDRTDEIRHKQQIENECARLEAVLQALPVGVWITDKDGRITEKNKQSDVIWAGDAPQVENVAQYQEYPSWDAHSGKKLETEDFPLTRVLRSGEPVEAEEHRIVRLDGSQGYVLVSARPIKDLEGRLDGAVAVNVDITNVRRLEAERVEAITKNEVQRQLMAQRERDRHAMARDLHDGPIQTLSSSMFHLYMIKEAFPDPKLQEELDVIGANIKNTIRELRDVLKDLRPPALLHFGLSKVIKMYMEDFRSQYPGIEVDLDMNVDDKGLSNDTHLTLYRIFQAGINNVIRHSQATKVWVAFSMDQTHYTLTLRDNGKGFEVRNDSSQLTRTGHFGLVGMKERAEAIGGELKVTSEPEKGTTIIVRGPLN